MKKSSLAAVILFMVAACGGNAARDALEGTREISIDVCDPAGGGTFTIEITNPYLPFSEGQQTVLETPSGSERVQITVLPETMVVAGVTTRVVEEREWVNGDLVEVSRNFVAQAFDGSVCYFGEDVDDYSGGEVVGHGGAWRAGENDYLPGILMPGSPEVGTSHAQEFAPGVAEDAAIIRAIGTSYVTPFGSFDDTLEAEDVDPIGGGIDPKRYARDIGLIVDEDLELISFTP